MSVIIELSRSFTNILDTFFGSDTDLMSKKVKQILANPEDKEKYLEALKELKELEKKGEQGTKTIVLSNKESLTLTT